MLLIFYSSRAGYDEAPQTEYDETEEGSDTPSAPQKTHREASASAHDPARFPATRRDFKTAIVKPHGLRAVPDGTGRDAAAIALVVWAIGITMPVAIAVVRSVTGGAAVAPVVVTPAVPNRPDSLRLTKSRRCLSLRCRVSSTPPITTKAKP
jgi:hypothetical protein